VDRRRFLLTLSASLLAEPGDSEAQAVKVYRIGYVGNSSPSLEPKLLAAFRDGLRDFGYMEGRNIHIEYRWAEGRYERFPDFMADLARLKVDVIVVAGTPAVLAAKQATNTIPIVMAVIGDALEAGVVPSLARPGGNVTGLSTVVPELEGKRFELLKQALPKLSHVAILANPENPFVIVTLKHTQRAADELRVKLLRVDVRHAGEFGTAFSVMAKERPDAFVVIADRFMLAHRAEILTFSTKSRLPGMFPYREFVEDGGLMAYGPSYADMFRRSATYVHKIFKGAKPADLPVEQPTKFELVVNLKTAKALGLTIPPSLLLRADQVIE
jgi:putative tryptophan/tyrosine transport system substrate-binding protein